MRTDGEQIRGEREREREREGSERLRSSGRPQCFSSMCNYPVVMPNQTPEALRFTQNTLPPKPRPFSKPSRHRTHTIANLPLNPDANCLITGQEAATLLPLSPASGSLFARAGRKRKRQPKKRTEEERRRQPIKKRVVSKVIKSLDKHFTATALMLSIC